MATCPDSTDCLRAYYNPITAATCLSSSYSTPILSIPSQIGIHCHTGNALQAYPQSHLSLATQDGCPIFAPRFSGAKVGSNTSIPNHAASLAAKKQAQPSTAGLGTGILRFRRLASQSEAWQRCAAPPSPG